MDFLQSYRTGLEHDEPPYYKNYVPNADTEKGTLQVQLIYFTL